MARPDRVGNSTVNATSRRRSDAIDGVVAVDLRVLDPEMLPLVETQQQEAPSGVGKGL
jgi:hypothetical protein